MNAFRTHTGEVVTGDRLTAALNAVADDWRDLALAIRKEDRYASHVTEDVKDEARDNMIAVSEEIRAGTVSGFTIWQRVNTKLTGACVALFAKDAA